MYYVIWGIYVSVSQLVRFVRVPSKVSDHYDRNKLVTAKFLKQGYRYHKLDKTFFLFFFNFVINALNLSEPKFMVI